MDKYLMNILPRLREYGKKLNAIENFVDKTWVLFDEKGFTFTYRFLRSGKLLISKQGNVEEFTWEYIPPDSLYFKLGQQGIMLKHGFILDDLLLMQKEGSNATPMVFFNENAIPDGDLTRYILNKLTSKFGYRKIGESYLFIDPNDLGLVRGTQVLNTNFEVVLEKKFTYKNRYYTITNGKISKIERQLTYDTDKGVITITADESNFSLLDSFVKMGLTKAPDGVYKIKNSESKIGKLVITDGRITKVNNSWYKDPFIVIILIVLTIVISILTFNYFNNNGIPISNSIENNYIPTQDTSVVTVDSTAVKIDSFPSKVEYQSSPVDSSVVKTNNSIDEKVFEEWEPGSYYTVASSSHFVYFYNTPDINTMRQAHFDSYEKVYVISIKNGFGYVSFTNNRNQTSNGWLKMTDLIPVKD